MAFVKDICVSAAKKVCDDGVDAVGFSQHYVESAIDRFAGTALESIPATMLMTIAVSAAKYARDNGIPEQTSLPIGERREMVAAHLRKSYPAYAAKEA